MRREHNSFIFSIKINRLGQQPLVIDPYPAQQFQQKNLGFHRATQSIIQHSQHQNLNEENVLAKILGSQEAG